jgi:hypothetical protein
VRLHGRLDQGKIHIFSLHQIPKLEIDDTQGLVITKYVFHVQRMGFLAYGNESKSGFVVEPFDHPGQPRLNDTGLSLGYGLFLVFKIR